MAKLHTAKGSQIYTLVQHGKRFSGTFGHGKILTLVHGTNPGEGGVRKRECEVAFVKRIIAFVKSC